jgi:hypothetical protein
MRSIVITGVATAIAAASICALYYWVMGSEHAYDPANLLRISDTGRIYSFEVVDSNDVTLWRITSSKGAELRRIDYGVIPSAFLQVVPSGPARPRTLVSGEHLKSRTVTETQVLLHEGRAVGVGAMSWGVSTFTPRSGNVIPR